jgi:alpha-tubulin suppressor-like RCC1 family protein
MRTHSLFSTAGRGLAASCCSCLSRLFRRPASALAPVLMTAALGCGDDAQSPTGPASVTPKPEPALTTEAVVGALAFYQLSSAGFHTCGVTTDYRAYCWGSAALGDGTITERLIPVAVAGGHLFRQLSTDAGTTCAVTTDYRAYCWGDNAYGALGDGTTTERLTPVAVAGGHLFRQVDVGSAHTCGVTYPDRRAYCWGFNALGELGDGTTTKRLKPVLVAGAHQFREVSAGAYHTCGVTTADQAYCWGWNKFGQIGDGTDVGRRQRPALVAGGHAFRQLSAGSEHTCAVTTDHLAFCWGYGGIGQIGDGKTSLRFTPRAVAGGLAFDRVSAGGGQTCGETTANLAYCWGSNENGGLGDGTTTPRLTPVAVAGGLSFGQVSAGGWHTCGKTPAGVGYCWGRNDVGQVGDGTTVERLTPVPVAGPM